MLFEPEALRRVIDFLNVHHIPYMLIGGLAISILGETRATRDADFKINIDMPLADFRKLVFKHFPERLTKVPKNMLSPHVIHFWALPNAAADILVSIFDYEKQAIERAIEMDIEGIPARICTPEDLIIHKAIAERNKDWDDIEGILIRQRGKLDIAYIRNWLTQFAEGLENPEILSRFNQLFETT